MDQNRYQELVNEYIQMPGTWGVPNHKDQTSRLLRMTGRLKHSFSVFRCHMSRERGEEEDSGDHREEKIMTVSHDWRQNECWMVSMMCCTKCKNKCSWLNCGPTPRFITSWFSCISASWSPLSSTAVSSQSPSPQSWSDCDSVRECQRFRPWLKGTHSSLNVVFIPEPIFNTV